MLQSIGSLSSWQGVQKICRVGIDVCGSKARSRLLDLVKETLLTAGCYACFDTNLREDEVPDADLLVVLVEERLVVTAMHDIARVHRWQRQLPVLVVAAAMSGQSIARLLTAGAQARTLAKNDPSVLGKADPPA